MALVKNIHLVTVETGRRRSEGLFTLFSLAQFLPQPTLDGPEKRSNNLALDLSKLRNFIHPAEPFKLAVANIGQMCSPVLESVEDMCRINHGCPTLFTVLSKKLD